MARPTDQAHATDDFDDAVDQLRADYDRTPYTSVSFPPSAPGQLAAVAHLFGLETPDVSTARVLEIGCATPVSGEADRRLTEMKLLRVHS